MTIHIRHTLRVLPIWCALILLVFSGKSSAAYDAGDIAANFTLTNRATGEAVSLYDYEGYVILLDFFAYW